jgi:hypothetical protein
MVYHRAAKKSKPQLHTKWMNLLYLMQNKKSQIQVFTPHASIHVKDKSRQDKSMVPEVRIEFTLCGGGIDWERAQGHLLWC